MSYFKLFLKMFLDALMCELQLPSAPGHLHVTVALCCS